MSAGPQTTSLVRMWLLTMASVHHQAASSSVKPQPSAQKPMGECIVCNWVCYTSFWWNSLHSPKAYLHRMPLILSRWHGMCVCSVADTHTCTLCCCAGTLKSLASIHQSRCVELAVMIYCLCDNTPAVCSSRPPAATGTASQCLVMSQQS
jgi:hypothetical protein